LKRLLLDSNTIIDARSEAGRFKGKRKMKQEIESIQHDLIDLTIHFWEPIHRPRWRDVQKLSNKKLADFIIYTFWYELDIIQRSKLPHEYLFICNLSTLKFLSLFCLLTHNATLAAILLLIRLDQNVLKRELIRRVTLKHWHKKGHDQPGWGTLLMRAFLYDEILPLAKAIERNLQKQNLAFRMRKTVREWIGKLIEGQISECHDLFLKAMSFYHTLCEKITDRLVKGAPLSVVSGYSNPSWEKLSPQVLGACLLVGRRMMLPMLEILDRLPLEVYKIKKAEVRQVLQDVFSGSLVSIFETKINKDGELYRPYLEAILADTKDPETILIDEEEREAKEETYERKVESAKHIFRERLKRVLRDFEVDAVTSAIWDHWNGLPVPEAARKARVSSSKLYKILNQIKPG